MEYFVGQELAYRGRQGWNIVTVTEIMKTQARLSNGSRCRLSDGLVINTGGTVGREYAKSANDPAIQAKIREYNLLVKHEERRNRAKRRLRAAIDFVQRESLSMPVHECEAIAEFIEKIQQRHLARE